MHARVPGRYGRRKTSPVGRLRRFRSDGAQVLRNERPRHAGTGARIDRNTQFRFFLDMNLDDASWDATTFTKNRDRLVEHEVARQFFEEVVRRAKTAGLVSAEHFTVDGTLIGAWASMKSFRKKGEKPEERPPPRAKGTLAPQVRRGGPGPVTPPTRRGQSASLRSD
jgi:hypothetical protein